MFDPTFYSCDQSIPVLHWVISAAIVLIVATVGFMIGWCSAPKDKIIK